MVCATLLRLCQAGDGAPLDEFPGDSITSGDASAVILNEKFGLTLLMYI